MSATRTGVTIVSDLVTVASFGSNYDGHGSIRADLVWPTE
jgi:hypothetical protein